MSIDSCGLLLFLVCFPVFSITVGFVLIEGIVSIMAPLIWRVSLKSLEQQQNDSDYQDGDVHFPHVIPVDRNGDVQGVKGGIHRVADDNVFKLAFNVAKRVPNLICRQKPTSDTSSSNSPPEIIHVERHQKVFNFDYRSQWFILLLVFSSIGTIVGGVITLCF